MDLLFLGLQVLCLLELLLNFMGLVIDDILKGLRARLCGLSVGMGNHLENSIVYNF